jgi:GNAT superfamily N-acetyltransferase
MQTIYLDKAGNKFIIRPISPLDKMYLSEGLSEMSVESRRQRFHLGKKEFSDSELKYLTEIDQVTHSAFITYIHDPIKEHPAGVIRGVQDSHDKNKLEIAITIVDSYQQHGLGSKLMEVLASRAIINNYTHFIGEFHTSNNKMQKLLENFSKHRSGLILKHVGEGFITFEVSLK